MPRLPPIVAFSAPSGTGKTTLIASLVREFVLRGRRVGVLKADAHRVVLDTPGKDSWRFAEAGACQVAVLSTERLALFQTLSGEVTLVSAVDRLFPDVDIVLVEGFRRSGVPTIRVHRSGGPSDEGWEKPRNVIAWASNGAPETSLPVLPLDSPSTVVDWLLARLPAVGRAALPTLVLPVAEAYSMAPACAAARRLGAALAAPVTIVAGSAVSAPLGGGCRLLPDLRPGRGLLGALYTGLAAAETPEVLLLGPRHWNVEAPALQGLLARGLRRADVVYSVVDGLPDPARAVYGHRCLSAIQEALLSGELRLTGWWGQVHTMGVEVPSPSREGGAPHPGFGPEGSLARGVP